VMIFVLQSHRGNVYPCALVISPHAPWIAASPDRKVYNPNRSPPFQLLEIKCPQAQSTTDVGYLVTAASQFLPAAEAFA